MKQIILIVFAFATLISCNQKSETTEKTLITKVLDEQKDLDAIMKTIEAETACFYKRDTVCWADTWINTDAAFQAWNNEDGSIDASSGWNIVNAKFMKYMKDNPLIEGQTTTHPEVIRKNIFSKFYGENTCFMNWDQYQFSDRRKLWDYSKENRLMEKVDGNWKIVAVNAFWDYKRKYKSKEEF